MRIRKLHIGDGSGKTMMIRWTLYENRLFSLKFHKFIKSDTDCMHDHPWNFCSIMLWGSYLEETDNGLKFYTAPCILFRKATYKHRILINNPCYTLVITLKIVRVWGFYTRTGWVKWFDYMRNKQNKC